jgi:ribonuclease HII
MLDNNHSGFKLECGIDEAGRGCGSGPVVVGAVILNDNFYHPKLNDSKKMSKRSRDEVFDYIKENSIWSVGISTPEEIDKLNILQATMLAMHRAIENLQIKPEYLIIDGNYFNNKTGIQYSTIIKGDSKFTSISAASVIAKVTRDNIMTELHNDYPHYDWSSNMGYLTKKHIDGIREFGICEHHRKSFNFKI